MTTKKVPQSYFFIGHQRFQYRKAQLLRPLKLVQLIFGLVDVGWLTHLQSSSRQVQVLQQGQQLPRHIFGYVRLGYSKHRFLHAPKPPGREALNAFQRQGLARRKAYAIAVRQQVFTVQPKIGNGRGVELVDDKINGVVLFMGDKE
jgi:hypothetical protein